MDKAYPNQRKTPPQMVMANPIIKRPFQDPLLNVLKPLTRKALSF